MTHSNKVWKLIGVCLLAAVGMVSIVGCGAATVASSSDESGSGGGISAQRFADGVHAVMMADRTVYAKKIVTRLKKEGSPVKPDEYWSDDTSGHSIPLPAQMFRMGAELVSEDPEAGFTYSLKSLWPLNPQHMPTSEFEKNALIELAKSGENFYGEEELGGKKFFTAFYPDRAVAEACWTCHNEHSNKGEDYPEFKEGDVMGAVAVRVPLN